VSKSQVNLHMCKFAHVCKFLSWERGFTEIVPVSFAFSWEEYLHGNIIFIAFYHSLSLEVIFFTKIMKPMLKLHTKKKRILTMASINSFCLVLALKHCCLIISSFIIILYFKIKVFQINFNVYKLKKLHFPIRIIFSNIFFMYLKF
jgi:hypothetical protein